MNQDRTEAKWDKLNAKIKQQWGELTDDEVKKAEGNKDELIARIQEKYGEGREAIAGKLNDLMDGD